MIREIGGGGAPPAMPPSASPDMAGVLMHILNGVLGILGFMVLGYGAVMMVWALYRHYRGQTIPAYHTQWLPPAEHDTMPPLVGLLATMIIGGVVVGMAMTGAWVALINVMIAIGQHIAASISSGGGHAG